MKKSLGAGVANFILPRVDTIVLLGWVAVIARFFSLFGEAKYLVPAGGLDRRAVITDAMIMFHVGIKIVSDDLIRTSWTYGRRFLPLLDHRYAKSIWPSTNISFAILVIVYREKVHEPVSRKFEV